MNSSILNKQRFNVLLDAVQNNINNNDGNRHYELEMQLKLTKQQFIDLLKTFSDEKEFIFENVLIYTYKPTLTVQNKIFRKIEYLNNELANDEYESKETLNKIDLNEIKVKIDKSLVDVPIQVKYSVETKVDKIENSNPKIKLDNVSQRLRITYKLKHINFKLDFTVRLFNVTPSKVMKYDVDDMLTETFNSYTLELEWLNVGSIKTDIRKLLDWLGGNNNELLFEIYNLIPFNITKLPQVKVITNQILNKMNLLDYVYLDKTDGLRKLCVVYKKTVYTYSYADGLIKLNDTNIKDLIIFDAEKVENTYYIFDVYYVAKDVRNLGFIERMNLMKPIVNKLNSDKCKFVVKEYFEINNFSEVLNYALTEREGYDGIVIQTKLPFTDLDSDKWDSNDYSFKLKPVRLITTDCLLIKYGKMQMDNKNKYQYFLYLRGNPEACLRIKGRVETLKTVKTINSKYADAHGFTINKDKNKPYELFVTPYFAKSFSFISEDDSLDYKICEMSPEVIRDNSYNRIRWHFLRFRDDKVEPNSYYTGISNVSILFSPIVAESNQKYFQTLKQSPFTETLINNFHIISQHIRIFIYDKLVVDKILMKTQSISCLDIAGGRGGDLKCLYNIGVNNLFVIDGDSEALITYVNKAQECNNQFKRPLVKHILNYSFNTRSNKLNFNVINEYLGVDNSKILNELYARDEFKQNSIDIAVINYAFHYLCGENRSENIKALIVLLNNCLNNDGIILFTYYDGDSILKQQHYDDFDIEIREHDDYYEAKMPLPTISEEGYRWEPLILSKYFEEFSPYYEIIKEFNPLQNKELVDYLKSEHKLKEIPMIDYMSCVKVTILKKVA